MKTIGIVSEYNPFHNGHKYHIQASKEACNADAAICIMSGSFVQRGEPALIDKWSRAEMALHNGADLVIELPFLYACQPAEIFAYGAIKILNSMHVIDYLCFGSELGDTSSLVKIAGLLLNEPEYLSEKLKEYMSEGFTYPKAAALALADTVNSDTDLDIPHSVTDSPNNVLGIEYIKSLLQLKSKITPVAIKRIVSNYNDAEVTQPIASATAVRNEISISGMSDKVKQAVPEEVYHIMSGLLAKERNFVTMDDFSDLLLYMLRSSSPEYLRQFANIKEGIEHRLIKSAADSVNYQGLIENIKTKRYTRTFIQRLLCHILIGVTQEDIEAAKKADNPAYIRVLGFNQTGRLLLNKIKKNCEYPIITKTANFKSCDQFLERMFQLDIKATDIYNLGYKYPQYKIANEDYLRSPVLIGI